MKKITLAFLLLSCLSAAAHAKWVNAEIFMRDGSRREAVVKQPSNTDKTISVKETKDSKKEKIASADILRIVFHWEKGDPTAIEYWPIIDIKKNLKDNPKISAPKWLDVEGLGTVSLYSYWETKWDNTTYKFYLVKRADETAATTLIKGYTFSTKGAAKYFSDDPELAKKIAAKEKGYKDGEDLGKIVNEYNADKGE